MTRATSTGPFLAAALLAACVPGPAGGWESPATLSPVAAAVDGPHLAVSGRGDALLAWSRYRPPTEDGGLPGASVVEAALRTGVTGRWSRTALASPASELSFNPVPVFLASGDPLVSWSTMRRGVTEVTASEATGGAAGWSAKPVDLLFPPPGSTTMRASDPDGVVALAATDTWSDSQPLRVWMRTAGGAWVETPAPPQEASGTWLQAIAVSGGRPVLAWLEGSGGDRPATARTRLAISALGGGGGAWEAPMRTPYRAGRPYAVALEPAGDGTVIAVWTAWEGRGAGVHVTTARSGTLAPTARLATAGIAAPRLASGPGGTAAIAWSTPLGPVLRMRSPQGVWSQADGPASDCTPGSSVAALALGPSGEAVVVEAAGDAGDWGASLRASVRDGTGRWSGPVWLAAPLAGGAAAAIDGAGGIHAAWWEQTRRGPVVRATTTTPSRAGTMPGMPDPLPRVTALRVRVAAGRAVARFRLARPGNVALAVRRLGGDPPAQPPEVRFRGRAGWHAVRLPRGAARLARGRWRVTATPAGSFITGCPVVSRPFVVR